MPSQRLLILSSHVPTPDVDGGALRLVRIMRALQELGYQLTFIPRLPQSLPAVRERLACDRQALREHGFNAPAVTDPVAYLRAHAREFDLAIFNGFDAAEHLLDVVRRAAPDIIIVYDTVDLAHIREGRRARQTGDWVLRLHVINIARIEYRSIVRADCTWVVSDDERQIVRHKIRSANVDVLPGVFPIYPPQAGFGERNGLLFVGNFQHAPNVDAAHYLVDDIFPLVVEQIPNIELWIVGGFAPPSVQALQSSRVHIVGQAPDLDVYHEKVRVALAPIRYGAGIKTKVLSSMGYGVPVAMTHVAAEGLPIAHGFNGMVATDSGGLGASIVRLHEEQALWQFIASNSILTVERFYSPAALRATLQHLLEGYFAAHAKA